MGYLGSQLNSQIGTAARIAALRRTAPNECPRVPASRGSGFEYYWRSRDARFSAHLDEVRRALARDTTASSSIRVCSLASVSLSTAKSA